MGEVVVVGEVVVGEDYWGRVDKSCRKGTAETMDVWMGLANDDSGLCPQYGGCGSRDLRGYIGLV